MNSQFTKIVRIVLALLLLVFGINKFYSFMPLPEMPEEASEFVASLKATGYVLTVIGIFEIVAGLLLLVKTWVPFVLLLLITLSVNVLLFHMFLDIPGMAPALLVAILNGILIYKHRQKYKPLFG